MIFNFRFATKFLFVSIVLLQNFAFSQSAVITEIEVNQALGKQFKGALDFVAGKDTVVRAFLDSEVVVDPSQTKLSVLRNRGVSGLGW